jgi:sugar lactone lactonase YvrE
MTRIRITLAIAALLAACTKSSPSSKPDGGPGVAETSTAAAPRPGIDRGPSRVAIDGDPNGLWWDAASDRLLIADGAGNRILQWTDGGGVAKARDLPPAPDKSGGLGQLVVAPDGKVYVTRFGSGTAGGVVYAAPDGTTGAVPGLDPRRRRIGLAVTADGALYDTYFVKDGEVTLGGVARLDPAGKEVDVLSALAKPVGVMVDGAYLLVSDQANGVLLKAPLSSPGKALRLAEVPAPDLLCAGPDGSVFTGGTSGEIRQLTKDLKVRSFASGFSSVRGVAYDPAHRRLFASEHAPKGRGSALRIVPVD